MKKYVKVRLVGSRTAVIEIRKREKGMVSGMAVNSEGDWIEKRIPGGKAHEMIVAAEKDIICMMEMNNKYGELERVES